MKVKCPTCQTSNDIGETSRFHVVQCRGCPRQFRGVYGDVDLLDWRIHKLLTFKPGYGHFDRTACPHCGGLVTLGHNPQKNAGYIPPKVCYYCNHDLPVSRVGEELPDECWDVIEKSWRELVRAGAPDYEISQKYQNVVEDLELSDGEAGRLLQIIQDEKGRR